MIGLKINKKCCILTSKWPFCPCCRVVDTLKDYAIKALVNTVDHLGAVSCKVNDVLGETVNEVSETELRVTCIQQVL